LKYALGLAPVANAVAQLPAISSDSVNWISTFTKSTAATDVTCTVEVSSDLTAWTSSGVSLHRLSTAGGAEIWQATVAKDSVSKVFFRLRVSGP